MKADAGSTKMVLLTLLLLAMGLVAGWSLRGRVVVNASSLQALDLGVVEMGGLHGIVEEERMFSILNDSDTSWEIVDIQVSCGCVSVQDVERTIFPGQRLEVPFVFSSRGVTGYIERDVRLRSSDGLEFRGVVRAHVIEGITVDPQSFYVRLKRTEDTFAVTAQVTIPRLLGEHSIRLLKRTSSGVQVTWTESEDHNAKNHTYNLSIMGELGGVGEVWKRVELGIKCEQGDGEYRVDLPLFVQRRQSLWVSPTVLIVPVGVERSVVNVRNDEWGDAIIRRCWVIPSSCGEVESTEAGRVLLKHFGDSQSGKLIVVAQDGARCEVPINRGVSGYEAD